MDKQAVLKELYNELDTVYRYYVSNYTSDTGDYYLVEKREREFPHERYRHVYKLTDSGQLNHLLQGTYWSAKEVRECDQWDYDRGGAGWYYSPKQTEETYRVLGEIYAALEGGKFESLYFVSSADE